MLYKITHAKYVFGKNATRSVYLSTLDTHIYNKQCVQAFVHTYILTYTHTPMYVK